MKKQQHNNEVESSNEVNKVLYFGIYNPDYARNRTLIEGFRQNGFEVVECRVDPGSAGRFAKYWELFKRGLTLRKEKFDYIVVGFPGYTVVCLAYLLFGRRIIFDAFVSLQSANVYDRRRYRPLSFGSIHDWYLDWMSVNLAGTVLVHTNTLRDFFHKKFGISKKKLINVYLGANEEVFYPRERKEEHNEILVHFHGGFTKVQGLPYLIEAAHLLRDKGIHFQLVGGGIDEDYVRTLVEEYELHDIVELVGRVPLERVPEYVAEADICVGILGDTPNSDLMVPNKVFEYMAMQRSIVAADTTAMREVFEHGETAQLCKKADPESIAAAIVTLADDSVLRQRMAERAYALYSERFTAKQLVSGMLEDIERRI